MQWEYAILLVKNPFNNDKHLEILNGYGAEGWELVAVVRDAAFLKRQLVGPPTPTQLPAVLE